MRACAISAFRRAVATALIWALVSMQLGTAVAQDSDLVRSPVLVVESERLYRDSAFGQRVADDIAARNAELASENRQIEADLEAEELELTERRETLAPEEFRDLADAFDRKVREIRRTQEAKARAIARQQEESRAEFLTTAAPILEALMRDAGAAVMLERRSVFLSLNAIDITDDALERIDAEIGDGSDLADDAAPQE